MSLFQEPWRTVPQTLQKNIPSYPYVEYNDDEDIVAFFSSYNTLQQEILDWFNTIGLPIYTSDQVYGSLLDWVAQGLYGQLRPVLPSGVIQSTGPLNTWELNSYDLNSLTVSGPSTYFATSDDIFKRIITWNFYKGDGRIFNVQWLKRRIMRFLIGENGTAPPIDNTYQISVSFSPGNQVNIDILSGIAKLLSSSVCNSFSLNTMALNSMETTFITFAPLLLAPQLVAAINSAAVQLPFQYSYLVTYSQYASYGSFENVGGVLVVLAVYPTSPTGLLPGAVWSNGGAVSVVPGVVPNPAAPLFFFGTVTPEQLFSAGGGNLPLTPGSLGSGSLWNNGGLVCVS